MNLSAGSPSNDRNDLTVETTIPRRVCLLSFVDYNYLSAVGSITTNLTQNLESVRKGTLCFSCAKISKGDRFCCAVGR